MDQIVRSVALLTFYAALFVIVRLTKPALNHDERRVYGLLYLAWAAPVFVANYLLALVGLESFIPWHINFMHTFLWIGLCLGWLYLGVRHEPLWIQFVVFATFSLVVKLTEQRLFGVWSLEHFFFVFPGNWSYLLGWSLADGLYPLLSTAGLALIDSLGTGSQGLKVDKRQG